MNTLIIYDSKFGNTEKVAQAITMALCDMGEVRAFAVDQADAFGLVNAGNLDLLIIGCPTQIHGISPAMRTFLDKIPPGALKGLPAAVFDTRYHGHRWITGSAGRGIATLLFQKGAQLVAQPESFFVAEAEGPLEHGELNRAAAWAQTVAEKRPVAT
jgi:flavodoxin